ncbi:MAG: hypothetical protein ACTSO9_12665 [Candidatus Helarchaeota archaeon]
MATKPKLVIPHRIGRRYASSTSDSVRNTIKSEIAPPTANIIKNMLSHEKRSTVYSLPPSPTFSEKFFFLLILLINYPLLVRRS